MKKTKSLENGTFIEQIPYPGAKTMFLIESEDSLEIKEIINKLCSDLK